MEALARQCRELDLNHVEPGGTLGREVELETLRKREGFFGRKGLVEGTFAVGVQVVLHQMNGVGIGVSERESLEEEGVFPFGALAFQMSQTPSGEGFYGG